jgi:hypothetical protein
MKNKFYVSLIITLLLCLAGWTAHARAQRSGRVRGTWEYKLFIPVAPSPPLQDQMNQLGAEGWELVLVKDNVTSPFGVMCYFKRPK